MSAIVGTWLLRMKTPVGTIEAEYRFEEVDGVLRGSASSGDETTPLTDVTSEQNATEQIGAVQTRTVQTGSEQISTKQPGTAERVTWHQRITKPLRLNLVFEVSVEGDSLSGESRAGRLPRTRVTGERNTA